MDPHRLAELRSLAYHRRVAARLVDEPALRARARRRVSAWEAAGLMPAYAKAWAHLLDGPLTELVAALGTDDERMRALRQATPFAGALPPRERWALWKHVAREHA